MPQTLHLLLLTLLGGALGVIGGVIFLYNKKWSSWLEHASIPFAAGTLLTVSLVGLIPEAIELAGSTAMWTVLITFLTAFFFENFIVHTHHHSHQHHKKHDFSSAVPLVLIGDTIHNLVDGVVIGSAFLINPSLGLAAALSTFFHEVPHEIGDFGILLKAGWKKRHIFLVNIASALATIFGAFAVYYLADQPHIIGTCIAIAAGIFLYLGTIDFLPHLFDDAKNTLQPLTYLLIGVASMAAIFWIFPHTHQEGSHDHNATSHQEDHISTDHESEDHDDDHSSH